MFGYYICKPWLLQDLMVCLKFITSFSPTSMCMFYLLWEWFQWHFSFIFWFMSRKIMHILENQAIFKIQWRLFKKKNTPGQEKFDIKRQSNLFPEKVANTGKVKTQIDLTVKKACFIFYFCFKERIAKLHL